MKTERNLTVKEAIAADQEELKFRCRVITDPLPLPFIPINTFIAVADLIKKLGKKNKAEAESIE